MNELSKWIVAAGLKIDHRSVCKFTQQVTAKYVRDDPGAVFSEASRGRAWVEANVTLATVRFG
jgi:hypothetical protein